MSARNASFGAANVKDVWTITVANTWAAGDVGVVTIAGLDLTVTMGASTNTTALVADEIKRAWESATFADSTSSCIPQGGGTVVGPMSLYTATVSGSTVILTADTAGMPQTISVSETTAGSGTLSIVHTTTGTGNTDWNNVDNWAEGAVPVDADDVTINLPGSFKTGLDQSAVELASLTLGPRFNGWLGLKVQNVDNSSYPWYENRDTELKIAATVLTNNSACTLVRINQEADAFTATSNSTGTSAESGRNAFEIRGTNAANVLNVFGGDNGFASNNQTATVATINQDGGSLTVGTGTTLTTVAKLSGTATINCAATTISSSSGSITQANGNVTTFNLNGGTGVLSGTGSNATVNMLAGTLTVAGTRGTITTLTKTAGTATIYTTVTNAVNSAGALSMTTGNMTSLVTGGDFTHAGGVTITAITQNGGTLTMPHASSVVTTLVKNAGSATIAGAATTSTNQAGALSIGTGNVTALTTYAGNVSYLGSGTLTLVRQYGGSLSVAAGATITTLDKPNGSAVIYGTCATATNYDGSLEVQTGNMTLLYVIGGSAVYSGAGTITTLRQSGGSSTVNLSATAVTTLDKSGGTSNIYCATATATNEGGSLTIYAGNMTTFNATNGTCKYSGAGTITALNLSNSTDFSVDGNTAAMTITTLTITDSAKFRNSTGRVTFTNPISFQGVLSLSPV